MSHDLDTRVAPAPTRSATDALTLDLGLLVLRVFVGLAIAAHGAQKLFGAFGGGGLQGTGEFFASVGYSPGEPLALLAGLTEFGGGLLLALGLAAPLAAAGVVGTMAGAYATTQAFGTGWFFGPELELFYVVVAFALILTGPGRFAVRIPKLDTPMVRSLALVLAVVAAVGAFALQG